MSEKDEVLKEVGAAFEIEARIDLYHYPVGMDFSDATLTLEGVNHRCRAAGARKEPIRKRRSNPCQHARSRRDVGGAGPQRERAGNGGVRRLVYFRRRQGHQQNRATRMIDVVCEARKRRPDTRHSKLRCIVTRRIVIDDGQNGSIDLPLVHSPPPPDTGELAQTACLSRCESSEHAYANRDSQAARARVAFSEVLSFIGRLVNPQLKHLI